MKKSVKDNNSMHDSRPAESMANFFFSLILPQILGNWVI